ESVAPNVGDAAPASQSRTYSEGTELSQITSDPRPDPGLYQITIEEAIASGLPTVISFSTPAFCTSRTCGPALEVLKAASDRFAAGAHFIHVEIYQDFSTQTVDPVVLEWRLPSEPWTYVVDAEGLISARFEGLVGLSELEAAIREVLA
ncbi:MAG: TlpA family protein disulfide reductase, partial [Anaerolineae bacterium]